MVSGSQLLSYFNENLLYTGDNKPIWMHAEEKEENKVGSVIYVLDVSCISETLSDRLFGRFIGFCVRLKGRFASDVTQN